jgi:hypothetical protein
MRELTRRQSNESKKAEIVNYYYQWQVLPHWKKKGERSFTLSVKTPNGIEDKTTLKSTTGMACLRGLVSEK